MDFGKSWEKIKKVYYEKVSGLSSEEAACKAKFGYTKKEITEVLINFDYNDKSAENNKKFEEIVQMATKIDQNILVQPDNLGKCAIALASSKEQLEIIAKTGVSLYGNTGTYSGSPLDMALSAKNYEKAEWLLELGVDPNYRNSSDISALHSACYSGDVEAARLLCKYGADVHATWGNDGFKSDGKGGGRIVKKQFPRDFADKYIKDEKIAEELKNVLLDAELGSYSSTVLANKEKVAANRARLGLEQPKEANEKFVVHMQLKHQKGSVSKGNEAVVAKANVGFDKSQKAKVSQKRAEATKNALQQGREKD